MKKLLKKPNENIIKKEKNWWKSLVVVCSNTEPQIIKSFLDHSMDLGLLLKKVD
jgi:hypothetical protein